MGLSQTRRRQGMRRAPAKATSLGLPQTTRRHLKGGRLEIAVRRFGARWCVSCVCAAILLQPCLRKCVTNISLGLQGGSPRSLSSKHLAAAAGRGTAPSESGSLEAVSEDHLAMLDRELDQLWFGGEPPGHLASDHLAGESCNFASLCN